MFLCVMKMFLTRIWFNSLMVVDFTIILDILNYKNIQQGVILNPDAKTTVTYLKFLYETNLQFSSTNKNTSNIIIPHSHQKVGIILNTSCEDWNSVFNSLDIENVFKSPFIWIITTEDLDGTEEALSQYPIEVDSDITIVYKKDQNFSLYEIFNTGFTLNGKVIVRKIGFWNNFLQVDKKDRLDLKGLMLRTTLVITKNQRVGHRTFIDFLDHEQPGLSTVDSLHHFKYYEILKYYRVMFNISFKFQRSISWGYHTNGTFDGMVGALQRFESDIGGSPIFVRADRALAIDYAAETWKSRPCFIFRQPKHSSGYYTIYTRPLSTKVWYCIVAFLVLSTVILGLMLRLKSIKVPSDEKEESVSLAFLFIWGAICQQGMAISRRSTAVKVVIFVIFIYSLTLYQYYNALVVSTLLQAPPKNIRTMEDLLRSNLKAGVEDLLYNKDFFKKKFNCYIVTDYGVASCYDKLEKKSRNSYYLASLVGINGILCRTTNPLAIEMYNTKIATDTEYNFYSPELGMAYVKQGGFAFHIDNIAAYRIMQNTFSANEVCDASEIYIYEPQNTGAAVAKRSPYKEHIAYGIRKMKERGIMRRLQTYWDASKPACVRTPDSSLISVSLLEFQTALIVLALGYLAAIVLFCFEILLNAAKNSKYDCSNCQLKKMIEFRN